jgi:hypothetical protein
MQKLLFILILCTTAFQVKAQYTNNNDSTIITRHYYRHNYYQMNNQNLSRDYLLARLNKFQSSADELSRSKIHLGISLFFLGAFAVSYIVPNPTSLVFSIIGIPSCLIESAIARKHLRKSIHLYNQEMYNHRTT